MPEGYFFGRSRTRDMRIEVYTMVWNEPVILRRFCETYSEFAGRIFVYDYGCTDNTMEVLRDFPAVATRPAFRNSYPRVPILKCYPRNVSRIAVSIHVYAPFANLKPIFPGQSSSRTFRAITSLTPTAVSCPTRANARWRNGPLTGPGQRVSLKRRAPLTRRQSDYRPITPQV